MRKAVRRAREVKNGVDIPIQLNLSVPTPHCPVSVPCHKLLLASCAVYDAFAFRSNFDCDYAFTLGGAVAKLMHSRVNGYLATVTGLKEPVSGWKVGDDGATYVDETERCVMHLWT